MTIYVSISHTFHGWIYPCLFYTNDANTFWPNMIGSFYTYVQAK